MPPEANPKLPLYYLRAAAVLLIVTAGAKFWSVTGEAKVLAAIDPVSHLTYARLMFLVGLIELGVAGYLLYGRSLLLRTTLLFWLASNFLLYRFASSYLRVSMCPCLGTLSDRLPLSKAQVDTFLTWVVLYLFLGSSWILLIAWGKRAAFEGSMPIPSSAETNMVDRAPSA